MARGRDLTITTLRDGTQRIEGTQLYRNKGRDIWYVRYSHQGRPAKRTSETSDPQQAYRFWAALVTDQGRGKAVGPGVDKITVAEGYQLVVADYRNNQRKTARNNEYRYRLHLEPFFGARTKLHLIRRDRVELYKEHRLDEGASASTVNKDLILLCRMFSLAVELERLSHAPRIVKLRERNTRKGFFEPEQFVAIRAKLKQPVLQDLVTVLYFTGWRSASEVQSLEWSQVNFRTRRVTLDPFTAKGDDARICPMNDEMYRALRARRDATDQLAAAGIITPLVFYRTYATKRGGAAKTSPRKVKIVKRFEKTWKTACRAAGYPAKLPHDFRRTAVRNLEGAGVSTPAAMRIVGHKTMAMHLRYGIVSNQDLIDAGEKMANIRIDEDETGDMSGDMTRKKQG